MTGIRDTILEAAYEEDEDSDAGVRWKADRAGYV